MKYGFVKVAAATPRVYVSDCYKNKEEILKKIKETYEKGGQLIVLPELCLTGYTCSDLFNQRILIREAFKSLEDLAKETKNIEAVIIIGLPLAYMGKLYNVAAVLCKGQCLGFVPKSYLPNYNEFYEARHYHSGLKINGEISFNGYMVPFSPKLIFKHDIIEEFTFGVEICEDLWVPNPPSINHVMAGANIICNLSASNEIVGKNSYRQDLVVGQSGRLVCGYIYANAGFGESTTDIVFPGQNYIAENGSLLSKGGQFSNETVFSEIDVFRLEDYRRKMTTYKEKKDHEYKYITFNLGLKEPEITRFYPKAPFVPQDLDLRNKRSEEILTIQSLGLGKRLSHIGAKKAMIGLSGGLDSTLALLVISKTFDILNLPKENIYCITMPCFGTTNRTYNNACTLSKEIGATLKEINIKEAVEIHFRDIGHDENIHNITYENSQARERTQILMDLANKEGAILVGTGDLSELALGWATYNGDHMSMYGVNASIPKTLVRYLVQYVGETTENNRLRGVLFDILDTPVSPELLPPKDGEIAQKTEEVVGPYELHDFYLYYMLREGFSPKKIYYLATRVFEGIYSKAVIKKWLVTFYKRFFSQQFKRSCLPDGPKVGSVALSPRGDLRMPSDALGAVWIKEAEEI